MIDRSDFDRAARALCRERCAFRGEPPCFQIGPWPNPECNEPGCHAEAEAVIVVISQITPEADALLCKIAALKIWRDTYPDGPDMIDQRYEILPQDVITARSYIAARDASATRPAWLPPVPKDERGK